MDVMSPITRAFYDVLPEIDPDSARMTEWIWLTRQSAGLNTRGAAYTIHAAVGINLNEVVERALADIFPAYYQSDSVFRAFNTIAVAVPEELKRTSGEEDVFDLYVVGVEKPGGEVLITMLGDPEKVGALLGELETEYCRPNTIHTSTLVDITPNGPDVKNTELMENEQALAEDAFYPWMEESLEEFARGYAESPSNVLLLIGPPGTGKSTFLRTMLFKMNREKIGIIDDSEVQSKPGVSAWVRGFDKDAVLVFEDADLLVGKREDGNRQMAMLLNHADGVISNDVKIIISTNLSTINKVDEALLRPGRNYAILEFDYLTAEQANVAREAVGEEPAELDSERMYTLGEALAHSSMADIQRRKAPGMGFSG